MKMYQITTTNHKNELLNQVCITNISEEFKCIIYPNLGASLQKFEIKNTNLIEGITQTEEGLKVYNSGFYSSFLFPFPNRISKGEYYFNKTKFQLKTNETVLQNAIHGHIYDKRFEVINKKTSETSAEVTLSYTNNETEIGFPFHYQIEITYVFLKNDFSILFKVYNIGNKAFPFGIGWHPYFKTPNLEKSILNFKAESQYHLNEFMIPTKEKPIEIKFPLLIEKTTLDDCFILDEPIATFENSSYKLNLTYSNSGSKNYLQVYTPTNRKSIAIEPMTCAPDSFNNQNGLLILEPNQQYEWQINLHFSMKN